VTSVKEETTELIVWIFSQLADVHVVCSNSVVLVVDFMKDPLPVWFLITVFAENEIILDELMG